MISNMLMYCDNVIVLLKSKNDFVPQKYNSIGIKQTCLAPLYVQIVCTN